MKLSVRFGMLAALFFSALVLVGCGEGDDGNPAAGGKYTISFNANGGSGTAPEAIIAEKGSSITLPSGSGLSRSGYGFAGWNTNSSGTGTSYSAGSYYTVNGKATLYAGWSAAAATGRINIKNSAGVSVSFTVKPASGLGQYCSSTLCNGCSTFCDVPVGSYTITATQGQGVVSTWKWTGSVSVSANQTSTVTIGK